MKSLNGHTGREIKTESEHLLKNNEGLRLQTWTHRSSIFSFYLDLKSDS